MLIIYFPLGCNSRKAVMKITLFIYFLKFLKLIFRQRKGEGERETSSISCLLHAPYRDQARNLGMCSDQELNQQPFRARDDTQPTELHLPGLKMILKQNVTSDFFN